MSSVALFGSLHVGVDVRVESEGRYRVSVNERIYIGNEKECMAWLSWEVMQKQPTKELLDFVTVKRRINGCLDKLDAFLGYRTYMDGDMLSAVDVSAFYHIDPPASKYGNIVRWYNHLSSIPSFKEVHDSKKGGSVVQEKDKYEGVLKNAVHGQVVTRFPPEPSGYLHIGHSKAALLNHYFARKFNGKLIIRFDDTNPTKEKTEFEESILEDLTTLGIQGDSVTHTSDYFDLLLEEASKLVQNGVVYCDKTPVGEMRFQRGDGIESEYRKNSVQENIRLWNEMQNGTTEGQETCLRAKLDMQNPNKCMRDPVLYRCSVDVPHHRTGTKYKAYPTYDFACPIVDSHEGVSHAMRSSEYSDRIPMYHWINEVTNRRAVEIYEFARMNFVSTVLSKRKLQWFVDNGLVTGWDDPRFPTIRGIVRRGLEMDVLLDFILEQGPSRNEMVAEWDKLWSMNKQAIDPLVPRYMAIGTEGAVPVDVEDALELETTSRPLHPKNTDLGETTLLRTRRVWIEKEDLEDIRVSENLTLNRWGNVMVKSVEGGVVKGTLNIGTDMRKTKKAHWCADTDMSPDGMKPCKIVIREYDHLLTKKKIEEDDDFEAIVNRRTIEETEAIGDFNIRHLAKGSKLQLERRGYFIVDSDNVEPVVLVKIPEGKIKEVSKIGTKISAARLTKG